MEAETIATGRLLLTPLGPGDADALVEVLADPRLHQFIGGRPATLDEPRARHAAMTAGSHSPDELGRNWVVRRRADAQPGRHGAGHPLPRPGRLERRHRLGRRRRLPGPGLRRRAR